MNVKNLLNHLNGNLNSSEPVDRHAATGRTEPGKPAGTYGSDKVSLGQYSFRNNEYLFAKMELEKFRQASFEKLKTTRSRLSEYESAARISREAAGETEMGKMLDNPEVREKIARRLL